MLLSPKVINLEVEEMPGSKSLCQCVWVPPPHGFLGPKGTPSSPTGWHHSQHRKQAERPVAISLLCVFFLSVFRIAHSALHSHPPSPFHRWTKLSLKERRQAPVRDHTTGAWSSDKKNWALASPSPGFLYHPSLYLSCYELRRPNVKAHDARIAFWSIFFLSPSSVLIPLPPQWMIENHAPACRTQQNDSFPPLNLPEEKEHESANSQGIPKESVHLSAKKLAHSSSKPCGHVQSQLITWCWGFWEHLSPVLCLFHWMNPVGVGSLPSGSWFRGFCQSEVSPGPWAPLLTHLLLACVLGSLGSFTLFPTLFRGGSPSR